MGRKKLIKKRTWKQFQKAGLLWWVNRGLHLFGWAIVFEFKNDEVVEVYPARTRFRGFTTEDEGEGFEKLSKYLAKNADLLLEEALE
ncbi:hypothetical protein LCGC14_0860640 [marine sediment metagenome]|uniref:Uncharacterized protein n=1 Tax=marine sediment metagenome TaxID=412755 RepID=A0A0F9RS59_9ZZZZ